MTPEHGFLHAIHETPDDGLTKLVYADWLEEAGDPAADVLRALVACQDHADQAATHRLADLLAGPCGHRFRRLRSVGTLEPARCGLFRLTPAGIPGEAQALPLLDWGWVTEIVCVGTRRLNQLPRLLDRLPWLRRIVLRVEGLVPSDDEARRHPVWQRVVALDFAHALGGSVIDLLDAWPPGQLEALRLRHCLLSDDSLETLAAHPNVSGLRVLDLANNSFGELGVLALARSPFLGSLEHLDLSHNTIGAGLVEFLEAVNTSALRTLLLTGVSPGTEGIVALMNSRFAPVEPVCAYHNGYRSVQLHRESEGLSLYIQSDTTADLAPHRHLKLLAEVTNLHVTGVTGITPGSWIAPELARWPAMPCLRRLTLLDADLDDFGLTALLEWIDPYAVREVNLGTGRLSLPALRGLLCSPLAGAATEVQVATVGGPALNIRAEADGRTLTLTDAPPALLARLPESALEEVRCLRLEGRRLSMIEAGHWAQVLPAGLTALEVVNPQVGDHRLRALLNAPQLTGLRRLHIDSAALKSPGLAMLARFPALNAVTLIGPHSADRDEVEWLRTRGVTVSIRRTRS